MNTTATQVAPIVGQSETAVRVVQPVIRDIVVVWYHTSDSDLVLELNPHLQLLMLRLNKQFQLHFFAYPKTLPTPPVPIDEAENESYRGERTYKEKLWKEQAARLEEYQEAYHRVQRHLERAALFLPCISNAFMIQICEDAERDPRLSTLLDHPDFAVMPIMMRPTQTGGSHLPIEPLNAYEGYQREVVCQQIVAEIEQVLQNNPVYREPKQALATLLLAPVVPTSSEQATSSSSSAPEESRKRWYHYLGIGKP